MRAGPEIADWLAYWAETVLDAQTHSLALIDFLLEKTRFHDRYRGKLNPRQEKVIARMFREGLSGFKGGLSAANYISITDTSRATATRPRTSATTMSPVSAVSLRWISAMSPSRMPASTMESPRTSRA